MNPGRVAGPGAAAGFARGGHVNKRPISSTGRRRPTTLSRNTKPRGRRNFAGRKYARGGFVNNFTTRRNLRSLRNRRVTRNRNFR